VSANRLSEGYFVRADEIEDRYSFEVWLNGRPAATRRVEAIALAHRAALRAMVILNVSPIGGPAPSIVLANFWCCITSRLVTLAPSSETMKAADAAAKEGRASPFHKFATAIDAAEAAGAYTNSGDVIAHTIRSTIYTSSYGALAYDPDWRQLLDDTKKLENGLTAGDLVDSPLWAEDREDWHDQHLRFIRVLDPIGFDVWREWYDAACMGQPAFGIRNADIRQTLERNIALGSTDGQFNAHFWKRDSDEINADIWDWVNKARAIDGRGRLPTSSELPPATAVRQLHESVTQFTQGKYGEIIALPDPLSPATGRDLADLEELYDEARAKAMDVRVLGSNMLGSCFAPIEELLKFTPEEFQQARINRIHAKLSTLRSLAHLHELQMAKAAAERDLSLVLQEEVAVKLTACVRQFNLLMAFDNRGRELNRLAHGPEARSRAEDVIEAMRPIINNIHIVGDGNTVIIVQGDHNAITNAPRDIHGDQAVERVAQQGENLVMSILQAGWRLAKAAQENGIAEPTLQFVIAQSGTYGPRILEMVKDFDEAFLWLAQHVDAFNSLAPLIALLAGYAAILRRKIK
jgi:hypothetical protein